MSPKKMPDTMAQRLPSAPSGLSSSKKKSTMPKIASVTNTTCLTGGSLRVSMDW